MLARELVAKELRDHLERLTPPALVVSRSHGPVAIPTAREESYFSVFDQLESSSVASGKRKVPMDSRNECAHLAANGNPIRA